MARSCSRPSSVIISRVHGGSHTQLMVTEFARPSSAYLVSYSMRSVSGQVGDVLLDTAAACVGAIVIAGGHMVIYKLHKNQKCDRI